MRAALVVFFLAMVILCNAHGDEKSVKADVRKACGRSVCLLTPEETQGPYYWYSLIARNDIVESQVGIPFTLAIQVYEISNCSALPNVGVDIWHCNAVGEYSHFENGNNNPDNTTFLRGVWPSDETGTSTFTTIYPGWYEGRTVHIHIKIHIGGYVAANGSYVAGHVAHTGQLYFDDDFTTETMSYYPYTNDTNNRITNEQDQIFLSGGGNYTLVALKPVDPNNLNAGVYGFVAVWVNSSATPVPDVPTSGPPTGANSGPTGPNTSGPDTSGPNSGPNSSGSGPSSGSSGSGPSSGSSGSGPNSSGESIFAGQGVGPQGGQGGQRPQGHN